MFKALAVVYHSSFWLYLNKLALWDHAFEGLLVTAGLGLLVHIHTEAHAVNHLGVALFCYPGQWKILSENSSFYWGEASVKALITCSSFLWLLV